MLLVFVSAIRFLSRGVSIMPIPPSNFSWVSETVAGFGFPYIEDEWDYLANVAKLSHVITMCHECPSYASQYPSEFFAFFPVGDGSTPSTRVR